MAGCCRSVPTKNGAVVSSGLEFGEYTREDEQQEGGEDVV